MGVTSSDRREPTVEVADGVAIEAAVEALFEQQLKEWKLANGNYIALKEVVQRRVEVDQFPFILQFNRGRALSSTSKVDKVSISERPCFLCKKNRPLEQREVKYHYSLQHYSILVNPFPIFDRHLTIASDEHEEQLIEERIGAMIELAHLLPSYFLFYNGATTGASAPDHFHFQAGSRRVLPIEQQLGSLKREVLYREEGGNGERGTISLTNSLFRSLFIIEAKEKSILEALFVKLYRVLPSGGEGREPKFNLLLWREKERFCLLLFWRRAHRPSHYFREGDERVVISPGSAEMGGMLITPVERDLERVDESLIKEIFDEVLESDERVKEIVYILKKLL